MVKKIRENIPQVVAQLVCCTVIKYLCSGLLGIFFLTKTLKNLKGKTFGNVSREVLEKDKFIQKVKIVTGNWYTLPSQLSWLHNHQKKNTLSK